MNVKTNYNKMSAKTSAEEIVAEKVVDEKVEEPVVENKPETEIYAGVVCNCVKLNVRKKPRRNADVITIIDKDTNVWVVPVKSTEDFYKVIVDENTHGYCVKNYIDIKK